MDTQIERDRDIFPRVLRRLCCNLDSFSFLSDLFATLRDVINCKGTASAVGKFDLYCDSVNLTEYKKKYTRVPELVTLNSEKIWILEVGIYFSFDFSSF